MTPGSNCTLNGALNVLDNAELKFWATVLTPQAKDELALALSLHSGVSPQFGSFDRMARFDLHPLGAVRKALAARADRESPWEQDIR
jgi:hypothetical protein